MERNKYDLAKEEEVKQYLLDKKIFGENQFRIAEIGNGNMNYVYRITDSTSNASIILKYAANHTRISEDIPVSTRRILIEANALSIFSSYVPDYVPELKLFDKNNDCILMKDYHDYHVMRDLLLDYVQISDFAEQITDYLINSILPTSELVLDSSAQRELNERFENPLCDITKTFVFTEPFHSQSSTNAILAENLNFIEQAVFQDKQLLNEIEHLKYIFSKRKQALLHGDLHTGSIFTDRNNIVIFDFEFAFVGPIGFDLGNLIANFIFAWLNTNATAFESVHSSWIEETIEKLLKLFVLKFKEKWDNLSEANKVNKAININAYLAEIIQDTASYTGVELLRRVIGIAHVTDITTIKSQEARIRAERIAIESAKYYILNKSKIHNGSDFIKILHKNAVIY